MKCSIPHEEILPQNVFTSPSFLPCSSVRSLKHSFVKSDFMSNNCLIYNKSMPDKSMIGIGDYIMY